MTLLGLQPAKLVIYDEGNLLFGKFIRSVAPLLKKVYFLRFSLVNPNHRIVAKELFVLLQGFD